MKILRYQKDGKESYGILNNNDSILQLLGSPFTTFQAGAKVAELNDVSILCPVNPSKIIGVGLNYQSHIREMSLSTPESPMLFMKPPSGIIGQGDPIIYPHIASKVEYEAELVAVIGKPARHVPENRALDFVLGYTCGNDVSERVIQSAEMKSGAMLVCKGFDTFCPLGPVITTDLDPSNLNVISRLNGETKQNSNTSDLLFSVAQLVSYLSKAMLMLPGDIIMTGTPGGVGPMTPGDVVEVEVSGVGILRNPVKPER